MITLLLFMIFFAHTHLHKADNMRANMRHFVKHVATLLIVHIILRHFANEQVLVNQGIRVVPVEASVSRCRRH
jgi:predicted Na+-dependent transporter